MVLKIICKHLLSLFVVYVIIYLLVNAVYFFAFMEDRTFNEVPHNYLVSASYKISIEPLADRIEDINRQIKEMLPAMSLYQAPEEIAIDEKMKIDYTISLKKTLDELVNPSENRILQEGSYIKVTDLVMANLYGSAFDITEMYPAEQLISKTKDTTWGWEVSPKTIGEHTIYLVVIAFVSTQDGKRAISIDEIEKTIKVTATKKQMITIFLEKHWQWLLAAFGGSFAWLWARKNKKVKT